MCDCLKLTQAALVERNMRLPVMISRSGGPDKAYLNTEVIKPQRGLRPMKLICSHCPFCGEKYPDPDAETEGAMPETNEMMRKALERLESLLSPEAMRGDTVIDDAYDIVFRALAALRELGALSPQRQ